MMDVRPMDIDAIDDRPTKQASKPHPMTIAISEEEEARQAIEMLRGDDVSGRVAAANRLEAVASALGEERTRLVRNPIFFRSEKAHFHLTIFILPFSRIFPCATGIVTILD
jgi:hypothetical protein